MEKNSNNDLESQVLETVHSMLQRYQEIEATAEQMQAMQREGQPIDDKMLELVAQRVEVEAIEQRSLPLRESFREAGKSSPAVNDATEQLKSTIQSLMVRIADLETTARDCYEKLVPRVDEKVRMNQMKNAYGGR